MPARYEIGQKVKIRPVSEQSLSARDSDLRQYDGLTGEVTNYYWISPPAHGVVYVYTVRIGTGGKDIVLHEDELERA